MRGEPAARDLDLDLTSPRSVHIVGVGGAGMSAIATVLARMGHRVSGSDLRESRALERLRLLDVDHARRPRRRATCPTDARRGRRSPPRSPRATPRSSRARERGIPVLRRADALRAIVATPHDGRGRRAATARPRRRRCSR